MDNDRGEVDEDASISTSSLNVLAEEACEALAHIKEGST